jgi:hypothetical protein
MSRKTQYYPLKGGINTETPALSVPSGQLIDALNYEPVTEGGYRRIDGYERYDGRPLASTVVYHTIPFDTGLNAPNIGDIVLGDASFAHAAVVDVVVTSGAWATNDAVGYFAVVILDGVFLVDETLSIYFSVEHDDLPHDPSHS